jgi:protein required for attachment to host cells
MKPTRTWVLVADSKHGRILSQTGAMSNLEAVAGAAFEQQDRRKTGDANGGRPAAGHDSVGGVPFAVAACVDWQRAEKCEFASKLAACLEDGAWRDQFDRLILVAPPRDLGALRAVLGPSARGRLAGDLDRDMTDTSAEEIRARLVKAALL